MANAWQAVAAYIQPVVSYFQKPTAPFSMFPQRSMSGPLTANDLLAIIEGRTSSEGLTVSEYTALNLSAVWCAVQNIAGTVGKLPLDLYKRRADGGRDKYDDHPLYRILHSEPHPEMGAMVFRETLQAHVLLWGNGYAEILRNGTGRVAALQLITPNRVTPRRDERTSALFYEVQNSTGRPARLDPAEILHVRGLSFDGITGYSVVGKARATLSLGLYTERFGTSLFSNGPKWSGVLQHPKTMSPLARAALREDLRNIKQNDFAMLEEGMTWIQTGMPAKDAEFLSTRQFQVEEIARWFNMPPHKLKDLLRATFSNIEHQGIDYLTDTIDPWLVKWEEEINRKLIAPLEQRIQYAEFMREALQQADLAAKNASYATGIQWGWLNRDEVRAKQNMNPIPDGDGKIFLVPANMLPVDKLGEAADLPGLEPVDQTPSPETPPARELPPAPDYAAAATKMLDSTLAAIERERRASEGPEPWNPDVIVPQIVEQLRAMMPAPSSNGHDGAHIGEESRAALVESIVRGIQAGMAPPDPHPCPECDAPCSCPARITEDMDLRKRWSACRHVCQAPEPVVDVREIMAGAAADFERIAQNTLTEVRATVREIPAEVVRSLPPPPELPPAPVEEVPAEPTPLRPEEAVAADRHAKILIAQRMNIAGVVRRMHAREKDKVRAAAKRPERLREWIGEFYAKHAEVFRAELLPSITMHLALTSSDTDPEFATRALVEDYIEGSKRQLHALLDTQPGDLGSAVDALLARWDIERLNLIPDAVMREEMAHHG